MRSSGFISCLIIVSVLVGGCRQGDVPVIPLSVKVTLSADRAAVDTRTIMEGDKIDGFKTNWTLGDKLGVYTFAEGVGQSLLTRNSEFVVTGIQSYRANFSGVLNSPSSGSVNYDLYAYYPYNPDSDGAPHTGVPCRIPGIQYMTEEGSFDPMADYMVSDGGKIHLFTGGENPAVIDQLSFRHLVAFVNLSVKGIGAGGSAPSYQVSMDDVIESVSIEVIGADDDIVLTGNFALDLTDGNMDFSVNGSETPQCVTAVCPQGTTLATLGAWLITKPFLLSPADRMLITLKTEDYTIRKVVTGLTINFAAAGVRTLNMTIDNTCVIDTVSVPDRISISTNDFADTYTASNGDHIAVSDNSESIEYYTYRMMRGNNQGSPVIQWQVGNGYFYNITSLGGITSLVVDGLVSGDIVVREGAAPIPSAGSKVNYTLDGNKRVYSFSGTNGYLHISATSAANVWMDSMEINFEKD